MYKTINEKRIWHIKQKKTATTEEQAPDFKQAHTEYDNQTFIVIPMHKMEKLKSCIADYRYIYIYIYIWQTVLILLSTYFIDIYDIIILVYKLVFKSALVKEIVLHPRVPRFFLDRIQLHYLIDKIQGVILNKNCPKEV